MQKLAPEMEKIKKKYGNTKDPELMQKMNAETQALYAKNKVNPLSGCLPLFIQMPIFFALSYLMDQSFLYIGKLKAIYELLASAIHSIGVAKWAPMVNELAIAHTPQNLLHKFDMAPVKDPVTGALSFHNLEKILNRFTPEDWEKLFHGNPANTAVSSLVNEAPTEVYNQIVGLLEQKQNIEMFFGLNMLEASGWRFPQLIIPILTVVTTLLTSWLSMKMTAKTNQDQNAVMQQRIMLFSMPLVMGFFTVGYPFGVGIYWINRSVFQVVQQVFLNKKYGVQLSVEKREENSHI
jgi:YidC/Oxa1 family membrane protein insertase